MIFPGKCPFSGHCELSRSQVEISSSRGCIPPDEQVAELPLLGVAVKRHGGHAVSAAVGGALAGSEGGAPAEGHVSRVTCPCHILT